jgi:(p)ppGpp synthase/HD superfamily hydrolase
MLEQAKALAYKAHQDQVDRAGVPYLNHIETVVNGVEGEVTQCVAYLHDVVEDTEYTFEDLIGLGFSHEIVEGVKAITKVKNEKYADYIARVKSNEHARKVKLSDLAHNMDLTRLDNVSQKDLERLEKYKWAKSELEG